MNKWLTFLICLLCFVLSARFSSGGEEMKLTSPAFEHNQTIPQKYTCQGEDTNPPLKIEGIPEGTKSLILIVDDPDAPMGTWDHWIVCNIPPIHEIKENSVPPGGVELFNSFKKREYGGPCPPSGTHHYLFKLYAMDEMLGWEEFPDKKYLEEMISKHSLAKAELIGLYQKAK